VTILTASGLPNLNPSDYNIISQIITKSGSIMETGLNKDFKLSGNSDLPA